MQSQRLIEREAEPTTAIGKSFKMIDGLSRVTGASKYAYDFELPGMLHGRVKRSTYPHARIIRIEVEKALALPGVKCVITAANLPARLYGAGIRDTPVLATGKVRFVGEPVAAVAAITPELAEKALGLIEVDYEPLEPVFDPEEALKQDCKVIVHPQMDDYEVASVIRPVGAGEAPNVCYHFKVRKGDVEVGFSDAEHIIENRFSTPMAHSIPLEPPACVVKPGKDGSLTVWCATQAPFRVRQDVSYAYELDESKVRIITCDSSGGYGTKIAAHAEVICAGLALETKRPVRIRFTREETFQATTVKHPFIITIKDGVNGDGRIVARKIEALLNGGAYSGGSGVWVTRSSAFAAVSSYKIDNFSFDSRRVYTNLPPGGPVRGFGSTQMEFATESQMDIIASQLGIDPVELRRRNGIKEGETNAIGETMHSISAEECLERVAEALPRPRQKASGAWVTGFGIAEANKYSIAPTAASAVVKVKEDGVVQVFTGAAETGQGIHTVIAQIVAEVFRTDPGKVQLFPPDTAISPMDEGGFSSRQTYNSGNAALLAAKRARDEILQRAAVRFGTKADELDLADGRVFVKGQRDERSVQIRDLFLNLRFGRLVEDIGEFSGKATWNQPVGDLDPETGQCETDRACSFYTSSAQGALVAVNRETGQVKVDKIACAVDVGRALNPKMIEGQIQGGAAMALGMAMGEEMLFEDGLLSNPDFLHYKPPSVSDVPDIIPIILENPHKDGPFGAKGCGEAPMLATAPAIANAVFDAVGVRIKDLPITAEKVLLALKAEGRYRAV